LRDPEDLVSMEQASRPIQHKTAAIDVDMRRWITPAGLKPDPKTRMPSGSSGTDNHPVSKPNVARVADELLRGLHD